MLGIEKDRGAQALSVFLSRYAFFSGSGRVFRCHLVQAAAGRVVSSAVTLEEQIGLVGSAVIFQIQQVPHPVIIGYELRSGTPLGPFGPRHYHQPALYTLYLTISHGFLSLCGIGAERRNRFS